MSLRRPRAQLAELVRRNPCTWESWSCRQPPRSPNVGQEHPCVKGVFHGPEQGPKREEHRPGSGLRSHLGLVLQ